MARCHALIGSYSRHQWLEYMRCQNQVLREFDGIGLCGTHINAAYKRPQKVIRELQLGD